MSQVTPGWYPDPSGQFAQRYHDGSRWTAYVVDIQGNRYTDPPRPASRGQTSDRETGSGQGGYPQRSGEPRSPSSRDYGAQGAGYGQQNQGYPPAARSHGPQRDHSQPDYGQQRYAEEYPGYDQGRANYGQQPGHGQQPYAEGYPGYDQGRAGYDESSPAQPEQSVYGAQQGYGQQQPTRGSQPDYGQAQAGAPVYGRAFDEAQRQPLGQAPTQRGAARQPPQRGTRGKDRRGVSPTVGLLVAVVGAILLVLSLFVMDFLSFETSVEGVSNGGVSVEGIAASESVDLSEIRDGDDLPTALETYANFGYLVAILVMLWAVVTSFRLPAVTKRFPQAPLVAAVGAAVLLAWHVVAMLADLSAVAPGPAEFGDVVDIESDTSAAIGAYVGVIGYVGLIVAQFLPPRWGADAADPRQSR